MKCRVVDMNQIDLTVQAYREHGMIAMEWIDCTFGCALVDAFGFREVRLGRFYNGQRDYLNDVMEWYSYDAGRVWDSRRKKMRTEEDFERTMDSLASATFWMRQRLKECGFRDPELAEIEMPEPPAEIVELARQMNDQNRRDGERFRSQRQRAARLLRVMWYNDYGRAASEAYIMASLLHIRETEKYGADRLDRVYDFCVESIRSFFTEFLDGSQAKDLELNGRLNAMFRKLLESGVEFEKQIEDTKDFIAKIQPTGIRTVEEDLKTIRKAANAAPEAYRRIFDEVCAGRQRLV